MEQRLAGLRSGGGGGFLPALSALAQAHTAAPGSSVESLNYAASTLDLKVSAPDAASLDRLSQQLRGAGLQADLTSGNARGKGYEGRIQVKSQGGRS
jgi:type II secretory pathway component PulL